MPWYYNLLIVVSSLLAFILLASFICFMLTFYIGKKKIYKNDEYDIPQGKEYLPYKDLLIKWMKEARKLPYTSLETTSFDGLKLHAKFYDCGSKTIEIMFHGYKGNSERDLCGGIRRAFALNHSVVLVDQRASSLSDGHVTTFGIKERKDCLTWAKLVSEKFGPDYKIILTGVSMGAATVIMASELDIPENVIGVLADCSYSSPKEVIKKVLRQIKLPTSIFYPLLYLGARIFGKFNLEEASPIEAIKNAKVPVILFHGTDDQMCPYEMSIQLNNANPNNSKLILIDKAGHCLGYLINSELYLNSMKEFFNE